jgi:hypothetical protein
MIFFMFDLLCGDAQTARHRKNATIGLTFPFATRSSEDKSSNKSAIEVFDAETAGHR